MQRVDISRCAAAVLPLVVLFAGCLGEAPEPGSAEDLKALEQKRSNPENLAEVELGDFFITRRVKDEQMLFIEFKLYALVDADQHEAFKESLEKRRERMRDKVLQLAQGVKEEQLFQPNLRILKTELATVVKGSLKTPQLYDVGFYAFSAERG